MKNVTLDEGSFPDRKCARFQPIHIYEAATGKPAAFLLRPGKRPSGEEAARVLRHVIRRIRANWPRVAITVRGDGYYCTPELMDLLESLRCSYILGRIHAQSP